MIKPGTIIGDRYEISETVGAGGMSIVYKANDHKLNRYVALKMLKPEFSDDKNFVTKFRVEAQSSACLSHPNIVSVYDVGEDDGIYYIVMELVEGITLKEYIMRQGHLSVEQSINFALQIASGIEVAHDNHIIHRDIKPQNIIVSKNGVLKVTDFGIARAATSNTISPTAMGSVHYISPEQARGGYSDERSDIYSLGITMFEMLTGHVPFEGDNNVSVALMHIQEDMVSPRAYYPDIPLSMEKIVFKCTQKRAERRYLTANALISDLKKLAMDPYADIDVGVMSNYNNGPTVMMSAAELEAIKNGAMIKPMDASGTGELRNQGAQSQIQVPEIKKKNIDNRLDEIMKNDQFPASDFETEEEEEEYEEQEEYEEERQPRRPQKPANTKPQRRPVKEEPEEEEDEIDIDDEMELDPRLEKAALIGGIAVAVLICIFLMIGISKMTGWFKFGGDSTTTEATTEATDSTDETTEATTEASEASSVLMINVVGRSQEEAVTLLTAAGITSDMYTVEYENSKEVEKGVVINQSVNEGNQVTKDSKLVITVSGGAKTVKIPDIKGKDAKDAQETLKAAGFDVSVKYDYSEEVEKDKVVGTDPKADSEVPEGSKVTIIVSNGKEITETIVPDLKGKTKKEAKKLLEEAKLELGEVTEEVSEDVEAGKVIRQSIAANTSVTAGNKVDITISKGTEKKTSSYTASFSGDIENNGYTFEEGETANVKLVFNYDGGKTNYTLLKGEYEGGAFPIDVGSCENVTGLSKNTGSCTLTVISSNGTDISAYFTISSVTITFKEVTE